MDTTSVTIALPEPIKIFVEGQVAAGAYGTAADYIQALIRADQKRQAQDRLEALLLEGLASESSDMTATDWETIRREGLERIAESKST
jgi:antitoxin ParD1/3/4